MWRKDGGIVDYRRIALPNHYCMAKVSFPFAMRNNLLWTINEI